ncbi:hypothetical protein [Nocardiopsis alba]|uniref:hypothetical protein n=1 Tax=Nocardiopsis alba TaxID=53437 RepID=UPI0033BE7906
MDQLMELRPTQFASVPNEAADTLPDLNSIGLLTIMLRHAPGYRFTVADVIAKKRKIPGPRLGKDAAYGAMDTLVDHRWACRVRFMCAKGHWLTGVFRTYTRFTDDDFREVCRRFTAGTAMTVYCKGCAENPEIPVHTTIRPGAKLTWSESRKAGLKYGHPMEDLMAPGGLLSTAPAPPASGIPEVGPNSQDDASPQVSPSSGFPTVGQPTVGKPEVFNKTGVEDSSSSGAPGTPPVSGEPREEDESSTTTKTSATAQDVMRRTGASEQEAELVLDAIEEDVERREAKIGPLRRYVAGFDDRDLKRILKQLRAQRSSQSRAGASEGARADRTCQKHFVPLDCPVCAALPIEMAERLLTEYGADRRPDLARRLAQEPAPA